MRTFEPVPPQTVTILHVCSGDVWAGAECMIATLLKELKQDREKRVIALVMNEGRLSQTLREYQIETLVLSESENSFVSLAWKACRHFTGGAIDIIHSHGYKENILSGCLAKAIGVRSLYSTIHGLPEPAQGWTGLKRYRYGVLTRWNYALLKRAFTAVVAVSHEIHDTLVRQEGFHTGHVWVIHNGIEMSPLTHIQLLSPKDPRIHIGTAGRMVSVKRFDRFLEVAAMVVRQNENVRFSILGDGPLKEDLHLLIKRLSLDNTVTLEPYRDDPTEYYRSLDVYMNTSAHEGIPLSILEAMACKKPIIAPRVGGIPEIVTHREQGYLVEGGLPDEFARYCLDLSKDSRLRRTLGENAYRLVQSRFSSATMADGYRKLYEAEMPLGRADSPNHPPHHVARFMS